MEKKIRQSPVILVYRLLLLTLITNLVNFLATLVTNFLVTGGSSVSMTLSSLIVLFILTLLIQIIFAIYMAIEWYNYYYIIDQDGVTVNYGVLTQNRDHNYVTGIDDINYSQSMWGKFLNYGNIILTEPRSEPKTIMMGVPNPKKYMQEIEKKFRSKNEEQK